MRSLFPAILFLLTGCASISDILVPPYEPVPIHIYNAEAYESDVAECKAAGANFKPGFSVGSALAKTVDGATSNTSLIPVSPLVPLYGAAGAAASAFGDGLDVASSQHRNVFRHCLSDETAHDGSAIIAKPDP